MKKILLVLLVLPLLMSLATKTTENIVGEWEGKEHDKVFSLIFDKEGYVYYKQNDQIEGGKQFSIDGKTATLAYVFDKTTEPYQLDIILTDHGTDESKTSLGIVNFINDDTIEIALGGLNERPTDFTGSASLVFHRKK